MTFLLVVPIVIRPCGWQLVPTRLLLLLAREWSQLRKPRLDLKPAQRHSGLFTNVPPLWGFWGANYPIHGSTKPQHIGPPDTVSDKTGYKTDLLR